MIAQNPLPHHDRFVQDLSSGKPYGALTEDRATAMRNRAANSSFEISYSPSAATPRKTGSDASALAAHFGKRTKKRIQEIDQILETLKNLRQ